MKFELILFATDDYDLNLIIDEGVFLETYLDFENEQICLESVIFYSESEISILLKHLFKEPLNFQELYTSDTRNVSVSTEFNSKIKTFEDIDDFYDNWLSESARINTMDEYGMLIGLIGYLKRKQNCKNLLLIISRTD